MKHFFIFSLASLFILPDVALSKYHRSCQYEIWYEGQGISRTALPNGKITGQGVRGGGRKKGLRGAKNRARDAVEKCFNAGLNKKYPSQCKVKSNNKKGYKNNKKITYYNLKKTSIKKAVFNYACDQARKTGQGGQKYLKKINIGLNLLSRNGCRESGSIVKGLSTTCKSDGMSNKERIDYRKIKFKRHYNKSASGMISHTKKYCKDTFNRGKNPSIHRWYVNKKGHLNVKFTCNK